MKTQSTLFTVFLSLLFFSSCGKEEPEPVIEFGNEQYQLMIDNISILGPLTTDRTYSFSLNVELSDILSNSTKEISVLENVANEQVSILKLKVASITISPDNIPNELPAYLTITEGKLRYARFSSPSNIENLILGNFNLQNSSSSKLEFDIPDIEIYPLPSLNLSNPFDFDFTYNEQLESSEILSDIEIVFDYEYQIEK